MKIIKLSDIQKMKGEIDMSSAVICKPIKATPTITDKKIINDILNEVHTKPSEEAIEELENASKLLRKLRGY